MSPVVLYRHLYGPKMAPFRQSAAMNVRDCGDRMIQLRDAILPIFPWFPYFLWRMDPISGQVAFEVGNYNTYYGQTLLDAVNAACDDYWVDRA